MPLTHRQIALIQDSMTAAQDALVPGDTGFYDRLFAAHPEYRPLFRDDIAGQGMKFMTTLALIADALTTPAVLEEEIAPLAETHAALGIGAEHYAPLGEALFETFRALLGDAFTVEVEAAWRAAYAEIAARMIARSGQG